MEATTDCDRVALVAVVVSKFVTCFKVLQSLRDHLVTSANKFGFSNSG